MENRLNRNVIYQLLGKTRCLEIKCHFLGVWRQIATVMYRLLFGNLSSVVSFVQGKPKCYNMMWNALLKAFTQICVTVRWRCIRLPRKFKKACKQQNWVFKSEWACKKCRQNEWDRSWMLNHFPQEDNCNLGHIKLWKQGRIFLSIKFFHSTWSTVSL